MVNNLALQPGILMKVNIPVLTKCSCLTKGMHRAIRLNSPWRPIKNIFHDEMRSSSYSNHLRSRYPISSFKTRAPADFSQRTTITIAVRLLLRSAVAFFSWSFCAPLQLGNPEPATYRNLNEPKSPFKNIPHPFRRLKFTIQFVFLPPGQENVGRIPIEEANSDGPQRS